MNTLKLSEAIRLGSMMKPQGFHYLHRDGKSCALGAAEDAIGVRSPEYIIEENFGAAWPWWNFVNSPSPGCPECREGQSDIGFTITHLNDDHRWTRERIADWVESIEKQHEEVQPVPTSCWDCSERIEDGVHDCPLKGVV